jgi:hypothetical protein
MNAMLALGIFFVLATEALFASIVALVVTLGINHVPGWHMDWTLAFLLVVVARLAFGPMVMRITVDDEEVFSV